NYTLSRNTTDYSVAVPQEATGIISSSVRTKTSSRSLGMGWVHDAGNERIVFSNSASGGVLGGQEYILRSSAEFGRIFRDPLPAQGDNWAFRATFSGAGSYRGDLPFYSRLFSSDESVRGLRPAELGPYALVPRIAGSAATPYSAVPAGANMISAANAEYRVPLRGGTTAAGFFDVGSGWLLPKWLGPDRPLLLRSTNGVVHGSTGIEFRSTIPGLQVPFRSYY